MLKIKFVKKQYNKGVGLFLCYLRISVAFLDRLYNLRIYPGTWVFIVAPAVITFLPVAGEAVKNKPLVPILPLAVTTGKSVFG